MTQPIPRNLHIGFTPGFCGSCEAEITSGIFCPNCLPAAKPAARPAPKPTVSLIEQEKFLSRLLEPDIISNLEVDVIAFIRSSDLFTLDDYLWILASTKVVFCPDLEYSVMIKKTKAGGIEVVYSTVNREAIYSGGPDEGNPSPAFLAHYVIGF